MNTQPNTAQQTIEQNVRLILGDLQIQLVVANARIAELEAQLAAATPEDTKQEELPLKANGRHKPEANPSN